MTIPDNTASDDPTLSTNILNQKFTLTLDNWLLAQQTKSYLHERLNPSEIDLDEIEFTAELLEQHGDPIRIRFSSWHSNQKFYIATIQYASDEDE